MNGPWVFHVRFSILKGGNLDRPSRRSHGRGNLVEQSYKGERAESGRVGGSTEEKHK